VSTYIELLGVCVCVYILDLYGGSINEMTDIMLCVGTLDVMRKKKHYKFEINSKKRKDRPKCGPLFYINNMITGPAGEGVLSGEVRERSRRFVKTALVIYAYTQLILYRSK